MVNKQKLELTWIGKENRPKLEPRILIEDPEKSYHAKHRISDKDIFDNMLIKGDNLLALKALEQEYAGKVKCIYIDPPFNTGARINADGKDVGYEDGIEHSEWLQMMSERVRLLWRLLAQDGALFLHLDDNELDYCKVLLDEVFGRKNFMNRIVLEARAPSAFSTVNPGVFKSTEYLLWYSKDRKIFSETSGRVIRDPDYAYNKWIVNPTDPFERWTFSSVIDAFSESGSTRRSRHPKTQLDKFNQFIVENAARVCRLASISDSGAGQQIVTLKYESLKAQDEIFCMKRDGNLDDVYVVNGQQLIFYKKNIHEVDGVLSATALMTNVWSDIAWEGIANEGGVTFKKGKKPERLIRRCLELASSEGDLVLDSFLGSGTTVAVAHKMGRRWIGIELGPHCDTHCVPRLKKVCDGEDQGGISRAVKWKGGGGFRYYKLAPSLLEKDRWDRWVINKEYRAEMVAEAVCKLEGFDYAPSDTHYWMHGHSTERDFIYITTQSLTQAQLSQLSDEVGPERTLLVLCKSFRGKKDQWENLTIKKIPSQVLSRCEWGHDDYSLQVENLPKPPPKLGQMTMFEEEDQS